MTKIYEKNGNLHGSLFLYHLDILDLDGTT